MSRDRGAHRADVDRCAGQPLHAMYVSVVDKAGVPCRASARPISSIREDRVTREVVEVEAADDPMHIALLVDNSQAAEQFHPRLP